MENELFMLINPFKIESKSLVSQQNSKLVMKLFQSEEISAFEAKFEAQKIAFAPVVFQVARTLRNLGILDEIGKSKKQGLSLEELETKLDVSKYGISVLLDLGLNIGLVTQNEDKFILSKVGHYLKSDLMTKVNLNFVHDVCYKGLFHLEEAIRDGKPSGLKELGNWDTIYEGLSELPEQIKKSWFEFDHYYSDTSFKEVLPIVFKTKPKKIYDVGGNTGKWAKVCVNYDENVRVTIVDLPGQVGLAQKNLSDFENADRISMSPVNILDADSSIPADADVIWMSQFLDCFSEEEIVNILKKAKNSMTPESTLYIMETLWDRQSREASTFCLNSTSIYFTALANGNSRMYHSKTLLKCIENAGLKVANEFDNIGLSHSIIECKL